MGILAIILGLVAWIGSAAWLWFSAGWIYAVAELVFVFGGLTGISLMFCTHCPLHKKGCVHGFIGFPARLLKDRCSEAYTSRQTVVVLLILLLITGFPQYWLFSNLAVFAAYWGLMAGTGTLVIFSVCPGCVNVNCPVKKMLTANV